MKFSSDFTLNLTIHQKFSIHQNFPFIWIIDFCYSKVINGKFSLHNHLSSSIHCNKYNLYEKSITIFITNCSDSDIIISVDQKSFVFTRFQLIATENSLIWIKVLIIRLLFSVKFIEICHRIFLVFRIRIILKKFRFLWSNSQKFS